MSSSRPLLFVFLSMFLLVGNAANAQDCGYVEFCGAGHYLTISSPENSCYHSNCMICEGGACHPICRAGCDQGEGDNENAALTSDRYLKLILAAAERRDLHALVRLGSSTSTIVTFNAARTSIQVRGCNGALVANLPLRSNKEVALAMALPERPWALTLADLLPQGWPASGRASADLVSMFAGLK